MHTHACTHTQTSRYNGQVPREPAVFFSFRFYFTFSFSFDSNFVLVLLAFHFNFWQSFGLIVLTAL